MIGNAITAMRKGTQLANVETWKNRTVAVNAVAALGGAILGIANALGYPIPLDAEQVDALAVVLVTVVGLFNGWSTLATSTKVGLPDHRPPDPQSGPGSTGATEWDADYRQPGIEP
jgi:hypothetical protein